jgi:hypothetical protein
MTGDADWKRLIERELNDQGKTIERHEKLINLALGAGMFASFVLGAFAKTIAPLLMK